MEDGVNHYEVMGLRPGASPAEIRAAYRELSKLVHPDLGGDDYQFSVLEESYRILIDPEARVRHDRELAAKTTAAPGGRGPVVTPAGPAAESAFSAVAGGCLEDLAIRAVASAALLVLAGIVFLAIRATGISDEVSLGTIMNSIFWILLLAAIPLLLLRRRKRSRWS